MYVYTQTHMCDMGPKIQILLVVTLQEKRRNKVLCVYIYI